VNTHSAGDKHGCSNKSNCDDTGDYAIPKESAKRLVNRQAVTIDATTFAQRKKQVTIRIMIKSKPSLTMMDGALSVFRLT